MKPPLWLTLIMSLLLGTATLSAGLGADNQLWEITNAVSTIACSISLIVWFLVLRIRGLSVKVIGVNMAKQKVLAISLLLIGCLMPASRVFYTLGFTWFPYAAGVLNLLLLPLSLYFFTTIQWKTKGEK